ncbi:hypothetical protein ACQXVK_01610 [Curtobacterium sp. AB451]|uniref:hypothetical protein n=1 Tax=Curtobacterium sp. AB451 TaxID=3422306 RepID=UPI003D326693
MALSKSSRIALWAGLTVAIFAILVGVWLVVPILASLVDAQSLAGYGQVGDIFGLAAAIFSGIGLLGVAFALSADTTERKRSRRPFVLPSIDEDGAEIRRVEWTNDALDVRLRLSVTIRNESQDPALNIVVASPDLPAVGSGQSRSALAEPLGATISDSTVLASRLYGSKSQDFLRELQRGDEHRITLRSTYESLNGSKWCTKLDINLSCEKEPDRAKLGELLNKSSGASIDGSTDEEYGPGSIVLKVKPIEGTWRQEAL